MAPTSSNCVWVRSPTKRREVAVAILAQPPDNGEALALAHDQRKKVALTLLAQSAGNGGAVTPDRDCTYPSAATA